MVKKENEIKLTARERRQWEAIVNTGKHAGREIRRAHIRRLSEAGKTDSQIAEGLHGTGTQWSEHAESG